MVIVRQTMDDMEAINSYEDLTKLKRDRLVSIYRRLCRDYRIGDVEGPRENPGHFNYMGMVEKILKKKYHVNTAEIAREVEQEAKELSQRRTES